MLLIQQIKKDQLTARKNKQSVESTILTTLLGEACAVGKNNGNRESTDAEVVAVVKKFIKNNTDLMKLVDSESSVYFVARDENMFLSQYVPTQLAEDELRSLVQKRIITLDEITPRLMGKIMAWLKENHDGQYDGKLASKVVRELLNG